MVPISLLCNTTPRIAKLRENRTLERVLEFVDSAVVCIGQRDSEAEAYLKSFSKIKLVYFPWNDSFRDAYQVCLDHAPKEGWHLRLDDDESPLDSLLEQLLPLAIKSNGGRNYDVVAFNGKVRAYLGEDSPSYYRELFYKWNSDLHYQVDLHQSLVGHRTPALKSDYVFYHSKSSVDQLSAGCRDFFIAGVWADHADSFTYWYKQTGQDPRLHPDGEPVAARSGIPFPLRTGFLIDAWYEMKAILKESHPEVQLYRDLDRLIRSGDICRDFCDWARRHNSHNDVRPHLNELHCFDKYIEYCGRKNDR